MQVARKETPSRRGSIFGRVTLVVLGFAMITTDVFASGAQEQRDDAKRTFDIEFSVVAPGRYSYDGRELQYDDVVALINKKRARSVGIRGTRTLGDLLCFSAIGAFTKTETFHYDDNGIVKKGLNASAPADLAELRKSCATR